MEHMIYGFVIAVLSFIAGNVSGYQLKAMNIKRYLVKVGIGEWYVGDDDGKVCFNIKQTDKNSFVTKIDCVELWRAIEET